MSADATAIVGQAGAGVGSCAMASPAHVNAASSAADTARTQRRNAALRRLDRKDTELVLGGDVIAAGRGAAGHQLARPVEHEPHTGARLKLGVEVFAHGQ